MSVLTNGPMLEFQCRADEYLEARRAVLRLRRFEYWMNLGWGPILVLVGLAVIARAPVNPTGYLVAAVGVALVLNGTLWFRHRVRVEWRMTRRLAYRTWMEIRDTGLSFSTVDGEIAVPWSSLDHIVETPRAFVLYRAPADLHIVPKRAFASSFDVASFRARLAAVSAELPDRSHRPSFRFETNAGARGSSTSRDPGHRGKGIEP